MLSSPLVRVSSGCSKGGVRVGDVDQEAEEEEKKKKEKRKKGRRGYIATRGNQKGETASAPLFFGAPFQGVSFATSGT